MDLRGRPQELRGCSGSAAGALRTNVEASATTTSGELLMNTNRIHQIRTATFTTMIAFIACASTASPTFAGETHDNGEGGSGTNSASPYVVPITALEEMT